MKTIVLGAGPTGLAASYFAQKAGHQVVLIEKSDLIGGKGAVKKEGAFLLDFGPHAYHQRIPEIDKLIHDHAGDGYILTPVVQKLVINGKTMSYPFRIAQSITKFNPFFSAYLLGGYLYSRCRNFIKELPEDSFETYGIKYFGRPLYEMCFGHYTQRVWGMSPKLIAADFAKRKLPKFSILGMIREWITGDSTKATAHLFGSMFGYHKYGMGAVYEAVALGLKSRGGEILVNQNVRKFDFDANGKIKGVVVGDNGQVISCDQVISTIPIPYLIELLGKPNSNLQEAAKKLTFRDILLAYLFLNRPQFSDAHWIYLVDNRFSFNRMSEQKNLTADCCPPDKTVLTLEISVGEDRDYSKYSMQEMELLIFKDLEYFKLKKSDVEKIEIKRLRDAYPIFINGQPEVKKSFMSEIGKIPNLISTGRQGLFMDVDMHDAMYLGKLAADAIEQNNPISFYDNHEILLKQAKEQHKHRA